MATNSSGAGAYANLTAQDIDSAEADIVQRLLGVLDEGHRHYTQYWLPMGTDAVQGYQALKAAAGDTTAAADYGTASTAASLLEKLYQVAQGNAYISQDNANGGNGTVTVGANGSGFSFVTFFNRVAGITLK